VAEVARVECHQAWVAAAVCPLAWAGEVEHHLSRTRVPQVVIPTPQISAGEQKIHHKETRSKGGNGLKFM